MTISRRTAPPRLTGAEWSALQVAILTYENEVQDRVGNDRRDSLELAALHRAERKIREHLAPRA